MSSAPTPKAPPTKHKKDRERERERKEKLPHVSERLKTVVRRLPPNLPEDVFWQSVDAWVSEETVIWKTFYPGKFRKRYA
jgi:regulator of nonsense transcripts 3